MSKTPQYIVGNIHDSTTVIHWKDQKNTAVIIIHNSKESIK